MHLPSAPAPPCWLTTNLRKSLEVHQNLHHLFHEHLLKVLVSPHEPDEHLAVPGLGSVQIPGILEHAGPGSRHLVTSFILIGATRSQETPGNQNLKENFTVTTIVKFVASCVQELEHGIEVNSNLETEKYCLKFLKNL